MPPTSETGGFKLSRSKSGIESSVLQLAFAHAGAARTYGIGGFGQNMFAHLRNESYGFVTRCARCARHVAQHVAQHDDGLYLEMDDIDHDSYEPEGSGMHDQPALDMQVQEPFEPSGTKRCHNMVVWIRR